MLVLRESLVQATEDTEGASGRASTRILIQCSLCAYNVEASRGGCLNEGEALKSAVCMVKPVGSS